MPALLLPPNGGTSLMPGVSVVILGVLVTIVTCCGVVDALVGVIVVFFKKNHETIQDWEQLLRNWNSYSGTPGTVTVLQELGTPELLEQYSGTVTPELPLCRLITRQCALQQSEITTSYAAPDTTSTPWTVEASKLPST